MKSIHKFSIFLVSLLVSYQSLAISSTLTGMQLGDDAAPLTIVEYRSLTCSHCADFSNNIFPEIKEKYIDTGKIKFEVRPFALNAIDLNAFKLLHCTDEKDFFAMEKLLFQDQKKWIVTKQSDRVLENSTDALRTYSTLFSRLPQHLFLLKFIETKLCLNIQSNFQNMAFKPIQVMEQKSTFQL